MLASLDNEVHFKKVFTDVEVFTAFVKDVLNIDIQIDKVETEKVYPISLVLFGSKWICLPKIKQAEP